MWLTCWGLDSRPSNLRRRAELSRGEESGGEVRGPSCCGWGPRTLGPRTLGCRAELSRAELSRAAESRAGHCPEGRAGQSRAGQPALGRAEQRLRRAEESRAGQAGGEPPWAKKSEYPNKQKNPNKRNLKQQICRRRRRGVRLSPSLGGWRGGGGVRLAPYPC